VFSYPADSPRTSFAATLRSFAAADGLPFGEVLTQEHIQKVADEEGVCFASDPDCVYTPAVTLWAFLAQCLSSSKSCVAAVARIAVLRVALQLPPCAAATGGYCKARAKLPERFLQRLALQVGGEVERQAPDAWRWKHRRVLLADGTECSLPDTPENQRAYPQPGTQKPGLGFPLIRLVVLLTFATASLVGAAMGPHQGKESGETALFRDLLDYLHQGDVVVADRYYCAYWLVAMLLARGVDVAFRLHARRGYDFRRGRRLGRGDHVVTWGKPPRPEWMDEQTYQQLPASLSVREIRFRVDQPGVRSREVIVATTLTDAAAHSKADVADLYHERWHVELDIRNLKQTLRMDALSCKTPERVRKEVWAHLLGYNLVRQVMAQAAVQANRAPRRISFAAAVQTVNAFRWVLLFSPSGGYGQVVEVLWLAVASHEVGNRPGRCEPRKVKRRPKGYPWLTRPRDEERAKLQEARPG
jgi:hypothetical protein